MAYFSNSSEADIFEHQCNNCILADKPCPIFYVQSAFNYRQLDNPMAIDMLNSFVDDSGICTMKPLLDSAYEDAASPVQSVDASLSVKAQMDDT